MQTCKICIFLSVLSFSLHKVTGSQNTNNDFHPHTLNKNTETFMLIEGIIFQKRTICKRPRFYSDRGISEPSSAINHRAVTLRWKDKYWMYTKCVLFFPSSSGLQKMFISPWTLPPHTNLRFLIWVLSHSPFAWRGAGETWSVWGRSGRYPGD